MFEPGSTREDEAPVVSLVFCTLCETQQLPATIQAAPSTKPTAATIGAERGVSSVVPTRPCR